MCLLGVATPYALFSPSLLLFRLCLSLDRSPIRLPPLCPSVSPALLLAQVAQSLVPAQQLPTSLPIRPLLLAVLPLTALTSALPVANLTP